jgi:hypothetical protein
MERESWSAPYVKAWTDDYAQVRLVDADERPDLVARFAVAAYPTLVALGPDAGEIARCEGFLSAPDLLAFLEQSRTGRSRLDQLDAAIAAADPARAAALRVEALREAVRLRDWPRIADAWTAAWASRALLNDDDRAVLVDLPRRIGPDAGPATAAVERTRAAIGVPVPGADAAAAREWVRLSLALNHPGDVATWYAADPRERTRRDVLALDYDAVWSAFVRSRRGEELIRLFAGDDPVAFARGLMADDSIQGPPGVSISAALRTRILRERVLPRLADLHGACLATGREADAAGVRAIAESRLGEAAVDEALNRARVDWGQPSQLDSPRTDPR